MPTLRFANRFTCREGLWFAGTLALIAVQGLLRLYDPFDGDQALFLVGARALARGARLYVEFWDNKQPGIYWFYWLGGRLFGFTQEGVRAFEILWVLALAAVLMAWLRCWLNRPWLSAAAALAVCHAYFVFAPFWALGQLEMLVGLPAALSTWLLCASLDANSTAAKRVAAVVAAGVCGGIVAVFKLVLAPIFVALAVTAAVLSQRAIVGSPLSFARLGGGIVAYGAGALLPLAATALVFARAGAWKPFLDVTFLYPLEALDELALAPVGRLVESVAWTAAAQAPWLPFAVLGARRAWRRSGVPAMPASVLALVWLAAALAVILVQKFSWWGYHMWLLAVPTAALAAIGADAFCGDAVGGGVASRRSTLPALLLLVATAAAAVPTVERIGRLCSDLAPVGTLDAEAYRRRVSDGYAHIAESVRLLPDDGAPIYVFGSPLYYLLSGRVQAIPIHGWAWRNMPERIWRPLPDMLEAARPHRIFIAFDLEVLLHQREARLVAFLDGNYQRERTDALGTWFVRITPP